VLSFPDVVNDFHEGQQPVKDVSAFDKRRLIRGEDPISYRVKFGGVGFGDYLKITLIKAIGLYCEI
jgi:hypothetical protein